MDRQEVPQLPTWFASHQPEPIPAPQSLHAAAWNAAEEHKWLESQKMGRDLGNMAILDWYRNHWRSFCRHRRLEHLGGVRKWVEFNEESFGRMSSAMTHDSFSMVGPQSMLDPNIVEIVFHKLAQGCENLTIIDWAQGQFLNSSRSRVDAIVELLTIVDINSARMDPRLDESLTHALGSRC